MGEDRRRRGRRAAPAEASRRSDGYFVRPVDYNARVNSPWRRSRRWDHGEHCPVGSPRVVVRPVLLGALGRAVIAQDGGVKEATASQHGGGLWPLALGEGARRRPGAALIPDRAVEVARRVAPAAQGEGVGSDRAGGSGREARGAGRLDAGVRRPAHRAALVAAARRAADRGGLPEAGRGQGALARDPRPPRSRRQQVPGLAQDRPDRRRADGDRRRPPGRVLRRRRLGQRDRQARLRRPGPRHVPVREPSRPRGRRLPARPRGRDRPGAG